MGGYPIPPPPQPGWVGQDPRIQQPVQGGTQLYPPNQGAEIVNGINQFLTNFRQQKNADKQQAMQEFSTYIQMMQQGIPIDHKKIAQAGQKAGLPIDFTNPQPASPPIPPGAEQIGGAPGAPTGMGATQGPAGLPTVSPNIPVPGMNAPGAPGFTPPPAAPPPHGFGRFAEAAGWTQPPTNPDSPGMAWLDKVKGMGQMNLGTQETNMQTAQVKAVALAKYVQSGGTDMEAMNLLQHTGDIKEVVGDEGRKLAAAMKLTQQEWSNIQFNAMMNPPQLREARAKMAESLLPMTHNNAELAGAYADALMNGKSTNGLPPLNEDPKLMEKVVDKALEFQKTKPGIDSSVAMRAAYGTVFGIPEMVTSALKVMDARDKKGNLIHPTGEAQRLTVERAKLDQEIMSSARSAQIAMNQAFISATGSTGQELMSMLGKGDQSSDEAIMSQLVGLIKSRSSLDYKATNGTIIKIPTADITGEHVRTWAHPFTGIYNLATIPTQTFESGKPNPDQVGQYKSEIEAKKAALDKMFPWEVSKDAWEKVQGEVAKKKGEKYGNTEN